MKVAIKLLLWLFLVAIPAWPLEQISIQPEKILQGQSFVVYLKDKNIKTASASFLGQKADFYPEGENLRAILPVPMETAPGLKKIYITEGGNPDSRLRFEKQIKILKNKFKIISYYLPPRKKSLLKKELVVDDWTKIEKSLLVKTPAQLWQGDFIIPCSGYLTQPFGTYTYINKRSSGRHRGIDFGSKLKEKTEILAANSGTVVFAEPTQVFGNTVVIDHGQGIHTLYFHLSKIMAMPQTRVEKGVLIGYMGNTGVSSATHLHLAMSVQNVRVDPMQWIKGNIAGL